VNFLDSDGVTENYTVPCSTGALRPPHVSKIGPAYPLLLDLENMVTEGEGEDGTVLGGKPISDAELGRRLGVHFKTAHEWRKRLEKHNYITCRRSRFGTRIVVHKSKKWALLRSWKQRKPDRSPAQIPAKQALSQVWSFLGLPGPCGPSQFRKLVEEGSSADKTPEQFGHDIADAWTAIGEKLPKPFAQALAAIRKPQKSTDEEIPLLKVSL
jgi:hypothetical protein